MAQNTFGRNITFSIYNVDGAADKYVQITYNGITKKDGKSTEVFSANGETYDIT